MGEKPPRGVVGPPEPRAPGEERALHEEITRGTITRWSLGIFAVTIAMGFVGMFTGYWVETKELLQIALPVESVLIGGVAGYYLGTGTQP